MGEAIHHEEYRGCDITINYDEDPMDPRGNDNMGTMVHSSIRNNFGEEYLADMDADEMYKELVENRGAVVIKPLYVYEHSGVTIRTIPFSSRWDSGMVGYIYATRKDIQDWLVCKNMTKKILAKANEILDLEVKEFDEFIKGEVYVISVTDEYGEDIETVGGYYGSVEDIIIDGKSTVDWFVTRPGTQIELDFKKGEQPCQ